MPPAKEPRILLIDDAARLRSRLEEFLLTHHFVTKSLPDGRLAGDAIASFQPDLLILDVMMPGLDGFELLKSIRLASAVPVIMLTALGGKSDRVKGLEQGADDYIAKPFHLGELLARIRAVLRRSRPESQASPEAERGESLTTGRISLDISRHRLSVAKDGLVKAKNLSILEFKMFHLLMSRQGEALSRDSVIAHVFDSLDSVERHNLTVCINRLRRILAELGAAPETIATIWGVGYSWRHELA